VVPGPVTASLSKLRWTGEVKTNFDGSNRSGPIMSLTHQT